MSRCGGDKPAAAPPRPSSLQVDITSTTTANQFNRYNNRTFRDSFRCLLTLNTAQQPPTQSFAHLCLLSPVQLFFLFFCLHCFPCLPDRLHCLAMSPVSESTGKPEIKNEIDSKIGEILSTGVCAWATLLGQHTHTSSLKEQLNGITFLQIRSPNENVDTMFQPHTLYNFLPLSPSQR